MADDRATTFSTLSPSILEREDRLRVGHQILALLEHHLGRGGLAGRRVLDIGCSSGIIAGLIASAAGPTVGIDVDEPALARARAETHPPNVEFRTMSADALDFPNRSFDLVICNQMYYWLEDPVRLMAEIARVLAPGGVCVFTTVNKYKLWEAQYRLPLLSLMPRRLADACVRLAGKGERFGCHYLSLLGTPPLVCRVRRSPLHGASPQGPRRVPLHEPLMDRPNHAKASAVVA